MTETYQYQNTSGGLQTLEADSPDAAIRMAANRDPHSGVIHPPIAAAAAGTPPTLSRSIPAPRIDPSSFSDPSFNDYEAKGELNQGELDNIATTYGGQLKGMMDLINAKYNSLKSTQVDNNTNSVARTKVLNANTGNTDSGTGASALAVGDKKNKAALDAVETERSAALQDAMGKVDTLKQSQIQAATAQKRNDVVAYNNLRTANAAKAEDALKSYIAGGGDLEKLKTAEPDSYNALANELGGEGLLQAKAIGYQPKDTYVSDKPEILGNKAVFFKKDAKTGAISQESIDIPQTGSKVTNVTRVPGDGLYVFHEDGTYQKLGNGGTTGSGTSGSTKPITSGKLTTSAEEIAQGAAQLRSGGTFGGTKYNGVGKDNYVDPDLYQYMYDQWTSPQNGGLPQDFIKHYPPKNYLNPQAPNYSFFSGKSPAGSSGIVNGF